MLRAVLDTNVIISGSIMDHGPPCQIIKNWETGSFILVISDPILQEVERAFHYPRIKRYLAEQDIEAVLNTLRRYGVNTPSKIEIELIPEDPGDNKFIVAAIEGEANYIVSGDRHLQNLGSYSGIKIVSPAEFIRILNQC